MKMQSLAFTFLVLASCATSKKAEPPLNEVPKASPPAAAATDHLESAAQSNAEKNAVETKIVGLTPSEAKAAASAAPIMPPAEATKVEPPKAEPAKTASKKETGVPASQARKWLENGNTRFVKNRLRKDGQSRKDIARLVSGQKPHTIVLSCSDSRVPPEIVFDQKLGEIFVVRTAGEALDANVIASIEYALLHLGSNLIVVMGHTHCGAVNAAINTPEGGNAGTEALTHLVGDIRPRLKASLAKGTPAADVARESWANAQGIAEELKSRSEIIREAVQREGVVIQPAMYYLNSGEVKFQ